jgi:hypothetical protein
VTYAVDVSGGVATFYFAGSGSVVGSGGATDASASFLTDATCTYF